MGALGSLEGRRALVTGASRGIGRSVTIELARRGAAVLGCARGSDDLDALDATLRDIDRERNDARHRMQSADLATTDGSAALGRALEEWGPPHIVVANMRMRRPWARLRRADADSITQGFDENLVHLIEIMGAALTYQRAEGFGRWIAISSIVAHLGGPGQGAYVAYKRALEGLMLTIAVEEGARGITANTVAPGFIETSATENHYDDDAAAELARMNLTGRAGTADEVAYAVGCLADPRASYITGVTLPVCGGSDLGWAFAGGTAREEQK